MFANVTKRDKKTRKTTIDFSKFHNTAKSTWAPAHPAPVSTASPASPASPASMTIGTAGDLGGIDGAPAFAPGKLHIITGGLRIVNNVTRFLAVPLLCNGGVRRLRVRVCVCAAKPGRA